jgi:hypothetical protein
MISSWTSSGSGRIGIEQLAMSMEFDGIVKAEWI